MGLSRAQASKSDLPNNPEREIGKGPGNLEFPFGVSREEMKTISSKRHGASLTSQKVQGGSYQPGCQ